MTKTTLSSPSVDVPLHPLVKKLLSPNEENIVLPILDYLAQKVTEGILLRQEQNEIHSTKLAEGSGKKFYTRHECCGIARITMPTLCRWINEGFVPSIKVGSRRLIPAQEFDELLRTGIIGKYLHL